MSRKAKSDQPLSKWTIKELQEEAVWYYNFGKEVVSTSDTLRLQAICKELERRGIEVTVDDNITFERVG